MLARIRHTDDKSSTAFGFRRLRQLCKPKSPYSMSQRAVAFPTQAESGRSPKPANRLPIPCRSPTICKSTVGGNHVYYPVQESPVGFDAANPACVFDVPRGERGLHAREAAGLLQRC